MIKKIEIENYKGIKEYTVLDFELNHLKPSQMEKENTFIYKDGIKAMAIPSLIAKNASGKTSILDAIRFADSMNSLSDVTNWVTRDLEKFKNKINRNFRVVTRRLQRIINEGTDKDTVREVVLSSISKVSRDLNFDEIFNNDLTMEKITSDYLNEGMQELERQIVNQAKQISSHIYSDMHDIKSGDIRQTTVKIDYSNGQNKKIVIGKEMCFNNEYQELDNLLEEVVADFENGDFISESFANFNSYFLYAVGDYSFDMIENSTFEFSSSTSKKLLRDSETDERKMIRLINDEVIRSKISTWNSTRDWGGEALINNFVNSYGVLLAGDIIKAIDSTIHHIEGSKELGVWILKEESGAVRSVSDLSFGTFKTIFILTEIYSAWKKHKTLLIDEIENGLNISLIDLIIKFATNEKYSRDGFQMIITTHNPLIFDLGVINPQNVFINITGSFERLIDNKNLIARSEDLDKVFATKNYFNEFYWLKSFNKPGKSSHTIIKDDIFELLDGVEESLL